MILPNLRFSVVSIFSWIFTYFYFYSTGIDVVKEAIRKLKFTQQLRKSETGAKTKKVELTISVDGVAIQEPKTHVILHMFPLHRISYCADDNGEKRFFSFIAKQTNQGEWFMINISTITNTVPNTALKTFWSSRAFICIEFGSGPIPILKKRNVISLQMIRKYFHALEHSLHNWY